MIDIFSLVLPHLVMAIAVVRLMRRPDLDTDPALMPPSPQPSTRDPADSAR